MEVSLVYHLPRYGRLAASRLHLHTFKGRSIPLGEFAPHHDSVDHLGTPTCPYWSPRSTASEAYAQQEDLSSPASVFHPGECCKGLWEKIRRAPWPGSAPRFSVRIGNAWISRRIPIVRIDSPVYSTDRAVRTYLHRTKLGFREARMPEARFPRITLLGFSVNSGSYLGG